MFGPDHYQTRRPQQSQENIFLDTGFPQQLASDCGTNFTSTILTELCQLLQIDKYTIAPLHHSANGIVERYMRTLQSAATPFVDNDQSNWCDIVPFVTFAHNSGTQRSVGDSPFYLMYHREPRIPIDNILQHQVSMYNENPLFTDHVALDFKLSWQNAQQNLETTQQLQKQRHDAKVKPITFQIGDNVFIIDSAPPLNKSRKLTNTYKGPFQCVDIEGNHLLLVAPDRPAARPFKWHMDFAKLARLPKSHDAKTTKSTTSDTHATTAREDSNSQHEQPDRSPTTSQYRKPKFQYPLGSPAPNRYPLRSKDKTNHITR